MSNKEKKGPNLGCKIPSTVTGTKLNGKQGGVARHIKIHTQGLCDEQRTLQENVNGVIKVSIHLETVLHGNKRKHSSSTSQH